MKLIIDRIEGEYIVCENCETNEIVNLEISLFLPEEIKEGALLDFSNGIVTILPNDDMEKRIEEKMNNLWE